MPTRATHHRAPPPPPRHPTPSPTHAHRAPTSAAATTAHAATSGPTSTHASAPLTPPAALVDHRHEATTSPHLDGFDPSPRAPYGVRLGSEELSLAPRPDLHVPEVPRAPEHTPTPRADATPSLMERGIDTFPAAHVIPDFTSFPTFSPSTSAAHDGTPEGRTEAARAEDRRDERGRTAAPLAAPTLPDRAREDAEHAVTESIERGAFCATPAGDASPDCPR